jgi:hypothetical protein
MRGCRLSKGCLDLIGAPDVIPMAWPPLRTMSSVVFASFSEL